MRPNSDVPKSCAGSLAPNNRRAAGFTDTIRSLRGDDDRPGRSFEERAVSFSAGEQFLLGLLVLGDFSHHMNDAEDLVRLAQQGIDRHLVQPVAEGQLHGPAATALLRTTQRALRMRQLAVSHGATMLPDHLISRLAKYRLGRSIAPLNSVLGVHHPDGLRQRVKRSLPLLQRLSQTLARPLLFVGIGMERLRFHIGQGELLARLGRIPIETTLPPTGISPYVVIVIAGSVPHNGVVSMAQV